MKRIKRIILQFISIFGLVIIFSADVNAAALVTVEDATWYNSDGSVREKSGIFPDASLTRYYAPHPVFFEGWQSSPRDDITDYVWDFGDGSENKRGFNAAHVYENPGNYIATLTVTYIDGSTSQDSISIEVLARDGESFYVDSQIGNDSYDGKCQTVQGLCGPWRTADKAFEGMETDLYGPGDSILFNRGQIFEITRQYNLGHWPEHGFVFADYGSGAKPVIQYIGASTEHLIYHGVGFGYVSFVDLEFRFRNGSGQHSGGLVFNAGGSHNILYLRTDAYDPMNGFFIMQGHGGDHTSTGTFLVDSTVQNIEVHPESTTLLAYWGSRLAMMDNYFDNSGNHIAYTSQDKGVIIDNHFSRPAFGRTALRIHGHSFEAPSNNVYVADNFFQGWIDTLTEGSAHNGGGTRYNYLLTQVSPNTPGEQSIENIVFERNIFTNAEKMLAISTSDGVKIRNNIFITNNSADMSGGTYALSIGTSNDWDLKPSRNIEIIGNTFVTRNQSYTNVLDQHGVVTIYNYDANYAHPYSYSNHEDITIANNNFYIYGPEQRSRFIRIDNNNDLLSQVTLNNNNYYCSGGNENGLYFYIGDASESTGSSYGLNDWQLAGRDLNSAYGDPSFADLFGNDGEFSAFEFDADLSLNFDSNALNRGYLYSNNSYYDFDLNKRYIGDNMVDIGAFEFQALYRADVDGSSQINTTDALLTLRNSLGLSMTGTAWQVSATTGDVNCDGVSNSTDALLILRYSLGLSMSETGWCE